MTRPDSPNVSNLSVGSVRAAKSEIDIPTCALSVRRPERRSAPIDSRVKMSEIYQEDERKMPFEDIHRLTYPQRRFFAELTTLMQHNDVDELYVHEEIAGIAMRYVTGHDFPVTYLRRDIKVIDCETFNPDEHVDLYDREKQFLHGLVSMGFKEGLQRVEGRGAGRWGDCEMIWVFNDGVVDFVDSVTRLGPSDGGTMLNLRATVFDPSDCFE
jgi:hypothetical protein